MSSWLSGPLAPLTQPPTHSGKPFRTTVLPGSCSSILRNLPTSEDQGQHCVCLSSRPLNLGCSSIWTPDLELYSRTKAKPTDGGCGMDLGQGMDQGTLQSGTQGDMGHGIHLCSYNFDSISQMTPWKFPNPDPSCPKLPLQWI